MTFLLFLLGQTFLFTEKTCQDTAPTVWYYCLVIIILVYVSLVCVVWPVSECAFARM